MPTHTDFWSKRADRYDTQMRRHDAAYDARILATLASLQAGDQVLDVGCASGEIGLDIASHVDRYEGFDPSPGMIELALEKARKRNLTNVQFRATDIFDPAYNKSSFSAALVFSVFHLAKDPTALLRRVQELLKPGGMLITETPCLGEQCIVKRGLIRLLTAPIKGLDIMPLRYAELETLIANAGFDITDARVTAEADRMRWIVAIRSS